MLTQVWAQQIPAVRPFIVRTQIHHNWGHGVLDDAMFELSANVGFVKLTVTWKDQGNWWQQENQLAVYGF